MTIDLDLVKYYANLAAQFPPLNAPDAPARRARFSAIAAHFGAPRPAEVSVQALELPLAGRTLQARLYQPAGDTSRLPLLVYFHGGGWVVGDLDTHDETVARLASDGGIAVCSVDYRLAPEFPYPAPAEDALDALMWLAEHRARLGLALHTLAVGGDSAGAHLAASAARRANTLVAGLVKAQLLFYPVVSHAMDTDSYTHHAAAPGLAAPDMAYYWGEFLGATSPHPDDTCVNLMAAAPVRQPADAVVVVAGHDPLHDEGRDYARYLAQHGAEVALIEAGDMTHGFVRLQEQSAAARAWCLKAALALRALLQE